MKYKNIQNEICIVRKRYDSYDLARIKQLNTDETVELDDGRIISESFIKQIKDLSLYRKIIDEYHRFR